jgi:hypothetical protein
MKINQFLKLWTFHLRHCHLSEQKECYTCNRERENASHVQIENVAVIKYIMLISKFKTPFWNKSVQSLLNCFVGVLSKWLPLHWEPSFNDRDQFCERIDRENLMLRMNAPESARFEFPIGIKSTSFGMPIPCLEVSIPSKSGADGSPGGTRDFVNEMIRSYGPSNGGISWKIRGKIEQRNISHQIQ